MSIDKFHLIAKGENPSDITHRVQPHDSLPEPRLGERPGEGTQTIYEMRAGVEPRGFAVTIGDLLCDRCLAFITNWLADGTGEVSPHEFLEGILILNSRPSIDRLKEEFCPRCYRKLLEIQPTLKPPASEEEE